MPRIIIADTSCLIILTNIGELDLLKHLYGIITTTPEIAIEYSQALPNWIVIEPVVNVQLQQLLEMQIDKGESSAIALALENPESTIILDDYKARLIADNLNIVYTGTIGIIIKAKIRGIIPSIKPLLEKIIKTNFRLSQEIINYALKEAGESERLP